MKGTVLFVKEKSISLTTLQLCRVGDGCVALGQWTSLAKFLNGKEKGWPLLRRVLLSV